MEAAADAWGLDTSGSLGRIMEPELSKPGGCGCGGVCGRAMDDNSLLIPDGYVATRAYTQRQDGHIGLALPDLDTLRELSFADRDGSSSSTVTQGGGGDDPGDCCCCPDDLQLEIYPHNKMGEDGKAPGNKLGNELNNSPGYIPGPAWSVGLPSSLPGLGIRTRADGSAVKGADGWPRFTTGGAGWLAGDPQYCTVVFRVVLKMKYKGDGPSGPRCKIKFFEKVSAETSTNGKVGEWVDMINDTSGAYEAKKKDPEAVAIMRELGEKRVRGLLFPTAAPYLDGSGCPAQEEIEIYDTPGIGMGNPVGTKTRWEFAVSLKGSGNCECEKSSFWIYAEFNAELKKGSTGNTLCTGLFAAPGAVSQ